MKSATGKNQYRLYTWLALAMMALSMTGNLLRHSNEFWERIVNDAWRILYLAVANYYLFEHTLPFFRFNWKRIVAVLFLLFVHIIMYSFGLTAWRYIGIALHIYTPIPPSDSLVDVMQTQMGFSVGSVLFFGIVRHVYRYTRLKQSTQQLRIEKQQAELNYLKSQTNPHFLFNTLNNIYSLARDKSDLAPESVLRLSKILRFMLYETNGAHIAIEQELKIISDYIELEKLRYDETLTVHFNYNLEDLRQSMPPLLLMPLVENAFKHGVAESTQRPFVDIHLSVRQRQLHFVVKNSHESFNTQETIKENIGLSNLRRQLELLYNEYNLSVQQGDGVFTASLQINLASHV